MGVCAQGEQREIKKYSESPKIKKKDQKAVASSLQFAVSQVTLITKTRFTEVKVSKKKKSIL